MMSVTTFLAIYCWDCENVEGAIKKAYEAFREIYGDSELFIEIAKIILGDLIRKSNTRTAWINHSSESYEEEYKAILELGKFIAYALDGDAFVKVGTELEDKQELLISKDFGIIELQEDEKFREEMEYLFTKAEFLKWKKKLEEIEKERGK